MGTLSVARLATGVGALLALVLVVYILVFVDWHQFGNATPPEFVPPVESTEAQLAELIVNANNAMQSEVQVVGDSRIQVQGIVKLNTDQWRWPDGFMRGLQSSERAARARDRAGVPVPEVRIDVVCRARTEAGERVASRGVCHLQRDGNDKAGWSTNFEVAPRPGTYHLRIWLCKRFPELSRTLEPEKLLLGSFPMHVVSE